MYYHKLKFIINGLEMLQEYPESSSLQDVTNNLTNVAISIDKQSKMEANIETLNLNLNHLFLLIIFLYPEYHPKFLTTSTIRQYQYCQGQVCLQFQFFFH